VTESDVRTLAATLHAALLEQGLTIATAESLTGGALGDLLSATPGASETYVGGVISYATEVKQRLLGVSESTINEHGVVSAQCAQEMASGVRDLLGTDIGLSTTGVAGPTTQEDKPVGMVFVGIALAADLTSCQLQLTGDRAAIRAHACMGAVRLVLERVGLWTSPGNPSSDA
jgi:nicotinamide-nucleotide amidase